MTSIGKQITEKLLENLDQDTVIDYVVNNYSCEVLDILQDDIQDMQIESANSRYDLD